MRLARPVLPLFAAALLALVTVWLLWPGVVTYDGVSQYAQAVSGGYDDWHPPVMARLWAGLLAIGWGGTGPLLAFQWALLWAGAGLCATALVRAGAPRAGLATLAIPLFPLTATWLACVLKDSQLIGALTAATGIVVWFRLDGRRLPRRAIAAVAVLLGYATLLRANSVFSVVPLALAWGGWAGVRRLWLRATMLVAACLALIALSGPVNHRLMGAERSGVERTLPLFDMAGIAHRTGLASLPDLPPAIWTRAEATHCYTPFYWDSLGDPTKCGTIATRLAFARDDDAPSIFGEWARMIAHHPIAYAAHRLAHLDATLRIVEPVDERLAQGPATSLVNRFGLGEPGTAAARALAPVAAIVAATPLGVPGWWLLLAGLLLWVLAATPRQPARDLGVALALSAIVQTASFAVVSIASDLRYHLWLIVATMLAGAMLGGCRGAPRGRLLASAAIVCIGSLASALIRARVTGQLG